MGLKAVIQRHPFKVAFVIQSIVIAVIALYIWFAYALYKHAALWIALYVLMFSASATLTGAFRTVFSHTDWHRKQISKQRLQIRDLQIKTKKHSDMISITFTIALSALNPNEQAVLQRLMRSKRVKQDLLRKELGWSRSKTSEVVRGLEHKNLLRKRPSGRTNILELISRKAI